MNDEADLRKSSEAWRSSYEDAHRRSLTRGLAATPKQRVEWLEQALRIAHASGALERRRLQKHSGDF
jgi:hypothetical protein